MVLFPVCCVQLLLPSGSGGRGCVAAAHHRVHGEIYTLTHTSFIISHFLENPVAETSSPTTFYFLSLPSFFSFLVLFYIQCVCVSRPAVRPSSVVCQTRLRLATPACGMLPLSTTCSPSAWPGGGSTPCCLRCADTHTDTHTTLYAGGLRRERQKSEKLDVLVRALPLPDFLMTVLITLSKGIMCLFSHCLSIFFHLPASPSLFVFFYFFLFFSVSFSISFSFNLLMQPV